MLRHSQSRQRYGFAILLTLPLALALLLIVSLPVLAQQLIPQQTGSVWRAAYWNNIELSGIPTFERDEAAIDYNWGAGSPDSRLQADDFSARWIRTVQVMPGVYRFTAFSDDGIRVYVDGHNLIDSWEDHGVCQLAAEKYLAGKHTITVGYYENSGLATVQFSWMLADHAPALTWHAEYFRNTDLTGPPTLMREDEKIDFDWGNESPVAGALEPDRFSVRWTQQPYLTAGVYRFKAAADDGLRLWVNDHLLIDQWYVQSFVTHTAEIYLPGDSIPIKMEYYENEGLARAHLSWEQIYYENFAEDELWLGEYYSNRNLEGSPDYVCYDRAIDFDWGSESPAPQHIGRDDFSVRWIRAQYFSGGLYRFNIRCDDGVRLYVDGNLVIDEWHEMPVTTMSKDVHISRGIHTVQLEYFDHTGNSVAEMSWEKIESEWRSGSVTTCAPVAPGQCAWIMVFRRGDDGRWLSMTPKGIGGVCSPSWLEIDGLPVDTSQEEDDGHPYRIEVWVDNKLVRSTGNSDIGEAGFLVYPDKDNYTQWSCAP